MLKYFLDNFYGKFDEGSHEKTSQCKIWFILLSLYRQTNERKLTGDSARHSLFHCSLISYTYYNKYMSLFSRLFYLFKFHKLRVQFTHCMECMGIGDHCFTV